jgi:hypothetical protein
MPFTIRLGAVRLVDQHSELEELGQFPFPAYSVAITLDPDAQSQDPPTCAGMMFYPLLDCP